MTDHDAETGDSLSRGGHLPDDAVVVRGGLMLRGDLMASAEDHAAENDGVYAISVSSWPDMTAEEIALRVKENRGADRNPLGHGKIRESAVGRIYGAAHPPGVQPGSVG